MADTSTSTTDQQSLNLELSQLALGELKLLLRLFETRCLGAQGAHDHPILRTRISKTQQRMQKRMQRKFRVQVVALGSSTQLATVELGLGDHNITYMASTIGQQSHSESGGEVAHLMVPYTTENLKHVVKSLLDELQQHFERHSVTHAFFTGALEVQVMLYRNDHKAFAAQTCMPPAKQLEQWLETKDSFVTGFSQQMGKILEDFAPLSENELAHIMRFVRDMQIQL